MDHLWSPWRYRYIHKDLPEDGCIFCVQPAAGGDEAHYIVHRGRHNFVILNLYPYTTGHLMVVPYRHIASLHEAIPEELTEMMALARDAERHLADAYTPKGFNIGMNIGESAGAGIAGHLHLHVLPRWPGDANFISVIGETRVMPETLADTYAKLKARWTVPEPQPPGSASR